MCFKLWGGGGEATKEITIVGPGSFECTFVFCCWYWNGIEIQFLTLLFIEQWVDCGFDERRCTAGTNESRVVRSQLGIQFVSFVFILLVIGSARCPIIGKKKKTTKISTTASKILKLQMSVSIIVLSMNCFLSDT